GSSGQPSGQGTDVEQQQRPSPREHARDQWRPLAGGWRPWPLLDPLDADALVDQQAGNPGLGSGRGSTALAPGPAAPVRGPRPSPGPQSGTTPTWPCPPWSRPPQPVPEHAGQLVGRPPVQARLDGHWVAPLQRGQGRRGG